MRASALDRARELVDRGRAATNGYRFPSAIRTLKRGLALIENEPDVDEVLEVRVRLLGLLAICVGETTGRDAAFAVFDEARVHIAVVADPETKAFLDALTDHNLGLQVMRMGQPEKSVGLFSSLVTFVDSLPQSTAAYDDLLMMALTSRSFALGAIREREGAVADLERVAVLARDRELPRRRGMAVYSLGNLHKQTGDLAEALRYYDETPRAFGEMEPGLMAALRRDQAEALLAIGLSDEAGRLLDEALPVMRSQRFGQDLAEVEMLRATAALQDGELEFARKMARASYRKLLRRGSAWALMAALVMLWADGRHALATGRIRASLVERALQLSDELGENHLVDESRLARLFAARLQIRRGRLDEAEELLRQVPGPRAVTPIDHRMQRRLCLAELAVAKGNLRGALTHARHGLAELGRVRDRMGGLELVSATAVHGHELGELAIRLVRGGNSPRRLFNWLELTRAQSYRYEPLESIEDPKIAERLSEVRQLSRSLWRARLNGVPTAELQALLARAQRDMNRLGWREHRWGKPRPVADFGEVTAALKDRAMVNFVSSGGEMIAVVLVGGTARMVRLGCANDAFESARKLHFDLNALAPDHLPAPLAEVIGASARRQADKLDVQLIEPLAHLIGERELIVVPTGALYAVPWGVLPSLHGRATVTAPSATAWLASAQGGQPKARDVLLVRGPGLGFADGEIDRLAAHHATATVLTGADATAAEVLRQLDGVDLVHVAAHGEHEPENALFSRLELVDGPLFAHELGRLRKPPAHVVLAACELALNRIRPGDEALGFAGAMLAGGTRTVVAVTSKVGDEASAAAMGDYHRALAAGAAPAVALAEAMAKDPFRRPFVCLGSG
ncbi:CHAT domain-containing protein [Lentzea tibetensis]|uniref:CHAT domain-containing protein n=1 Tax=Lentzea tibetensis TaxID=2591470 RepID=A0A563EGX2_9PSEU|nr:CHAT domain-containing protein [Lentzea tibetensis]TWP44270.1 CHAT domain-containing protein [Lentzea tibetensis]